MKRFIYKIFVILGLLILSTPFWIKLKIIDTVGDEVDLSISIVNELSKNKIDTVKIGDSVGKNLNPLQKNKDGVINICCNQAISPLGHIMLLKKVLFSQNSQEAIILGFFRPSSLLESNLDQEWTNNYFIKKFYNYHFFLNEHLISKNLSREIDLIFLSRYKPWSLLYRNPIINEYSPFMANSIGNNTNGVNSSNLIKCLINSEFKELLSHVTFQSMPVSSLYFESERKAYLQLRDLGLKINSPILFADTFFIDDMIHIQEKHRGTVQKILSQQIELMDH